MAMERGRGSGVLLADNPGLDLGFSGGQEGPARPDGDSPVPSHPTGLPRWITIAGWSLLGLQLLAMFAFSDEQYSRFTLTNDFAEYSQAWWAIAHGNLNPYIGVLGVPFWKNNGEFAMWPLALLFHIDPRPVTLLWVQDLAAVATEAVAFTWIKKVVERAGHRLPNGAGPMLVLGAAVVLVADPWVYETIAFDFHFEPIAAFFTLLVAYDLWAGRSRRMWLWVALALASTGLAGLLLVGVGISGVLAGRTTRRIGVLIAAVGAGWFLLLSVVGGIGLSGATLDQSYGYLVGPHQGRIGPLDVIAGALGHPSAVVHAIGVNGFVVVSFLVVFGVIGVFSPWGLGMSVVVLVPVLLDEGGHLARYGAAFQSWPAMPFVLIGSVMVVVGLIQKGGTARRVAKITVALWAAVLIAFASVALPGLPRAWLWTSPSAAAELAHIEPEIPADAEVVVSVPVMGRFADRDAIYGFEKDHQTFPVTRPLVVFVFSPYQSFQKQLSRGGITAATGYVEHRLGAHLLGARSGVHAFAWTPPSGTTHVTLP
jgi:uncharacterized membrane protein